MGDYMAELSQSIGLPYYPKQGPFGPNPGAVIGARDGYLVAVGPIRQGHYTAVGILLRFKEEKQPEKVQAAINAKKVKPSGSILKVDKGSLILRWQYVFRKPKPQAVAELVKRIVDTLKPVTPTLEGRCEKCQGVTQTILLRDGVPCYTCDGCQERIRQDLAKAASDYDSLPADLPKALVFGLGAAGLCSLAFGALLFGAINTAFNHIKIFLAVACLVGFLVGWAVMKGMGKITGVGQAIAFTLSLASVLMGDMVYYTLTILKAHDPSFGMKRASAYLAPQILKALLPHFWQLELSKHGLVLILFAFIGAIVAAGFMQQKKPKFATRFERLGSAAA